ncbi:hypothetical protein ACFSQQ_16455 [Mesorhizobium kowhaii]|uniref:hypothetical protein n=1 Tax=Mesorhizobium kowhaii TaxID=1300272 RepID=UPI0035EA4BC4
MPRDIPTLQSVSPEYARIASRLAELFDREHELNRRKSEIATAMSNWGATADGEHRNRVGDIIAGKPFEPRASVSEQFGAQIADIEEERRLNKEAIHQLQVQRAEEYTRASGLVCASLADEHRELAKTFYSQLATAAQTRVDIGLLRLEIERSGASALSLSDVGDDLLDGSLDRTGVIAQELRRGTRLGYLKAETVPEELR